MTDEEKKKVRSEEESEMESEDKEYNSHDGESKSHDNTNHGQEHHSHRSAHKSSKVKKADHTNKVYNNSGEKTWMIISIILAIALVVVLAVRFVPMIDFSGNGDSPKVEKYDGEITKMEFYVMSQCPYGTQVVDAIAPVKEKLGDALDLKIDFISTDLGNGKFQSLHGEPETQGNIVQLCAIKYEPVKYLDMIVCQNENAASIPGNWESCATKNGLDVKSIKTCYEGEEGKTLLSESIKKATAAQASGSPTMYLDGKLYQGGRGTNDFLRAICATYETAPEACGEIPEPVKVDMIVLNDKRCVECNVDGLVAQLTSIFPGLKVVEYDYSSEEGQKMYDELDIQYLPEMLFTENVKEGEGYSNVAPYLVPRGDYYSLLIGSGFDPTAEICDNKIDDDNNSQIDCADSSCKDSLICRPEVDANLKVFIMSDCPYGREAVKALKEVKENFGSALTFDIHYIASENGDGFDSLHGEYEVQENIVQLCAKEKSPAKWFDYVYCRSSNGVKNIDWKTCAESSGINTAAVETCANGQEGKTLLREDIKIANSLGISSSPTWLANNKYQFSGITAEAVKSNFCTYNSELDGCENVLSASSAVPSGSC